MNIIQILNAQLLLAFRAVSNTPVVTGDTADFAMALRVAANIQKFLADGVPLDPCLS